MPTRLAQSPALRQVLADRLEMVLEDCPDVPVPETKPADQAAKQHPDLRLRNREGAIDDAASPVDIAGAEESGDYPVRVRSKLQREPSDEDSHRDLGNRGV